MLMCSCIGYLQPWSILWLHLYVRVCHGRIQTFMLLYMIITTTWWHGITCWFYIPITLGPCWWCVLVFTLIAWPRIRRSGACLWLRHFPPCWTAPKVNIDHSKNHLRKEKKNYVCDRYKNNLAQNKLFSTIHIYTALIFCFSVFLKIPFI